MNVFNTLSSFNKYSSAKDFINKRFEITLPEADGVSVDFSCAADKIWMTFDLTKDNNFPQSEYEQFTGTLSEKLSDGTDASDEYQQRTTWTVEERLWDVAWDLTKGLAINIG